MGVNGKMVDRAQLEAAYIGFSTVFNNALEKFRAQSYADLLATRVNSNKPTEQYNWVGTLPKLKEWIGDRALAKLRAYKWTIENKKFANGLEVDRDDISDDNLGIVQPQIAMLGQMAAQHYD